MGFAIVHMQKFKSSGVRGIQSHNNREHPPKTNPDIDASRTQENYELLSCQNYSKAIKHVIKEQASDTKTVRKDAVVYCSFIVTSDHDTIAAMSPEQQRNFFADSVRWFADQYGRENIINATVHMDERTPHLHLGVVPVKEKRLSAKNLFTRQELRQVQTDFVAEVGVNYGLERGKEGSERNHLSEQLYKLETAKNVNQKLQARNLALQREIEEQMANLESIKLEYEEEHARTLQAVREHHELAQKRIPQTESILQELQNSVLSAKNKKINLSLETNEKIAEIENLIGSKASLEQDIFSLEQKKAALLKKYSHDKPILERFAEDIENMPAFIAAYKDKLCYPTKKVLQQAASQPEATSGFSGLVQPNFAEFNNQQQKQSLNERFGQPSREPRLNRNKGHSR